MEKKRDKHIGKKTLTAFLFIFPFLLLYTLFIIWPVIQGIYVSLHKWGLMGKIRFLGISNYTRFLTDKFFWEALWHTTWFVIISVPALIVTSLVLALLANRASGCKKLLRVCYYIPTVISVSVVSLIVTKIFAPYMGFLSTMLHSFNILKPDQEITWLMSPPLIWFVVTLTTVWWTIGFSMMLYISALQDIPTQVYEAAELDGAGSGGQLFKITLPLLAPTTYLVLLLQIIASFKIFGQIYLISRGGPGSMTRPLIQYVYEAAFRQNDLSYGAAMSYALFLILVILSFIQIKYQNVKEKAS
ncbi:carbohydrate ABC transporter permease [Leadbettera azotonutricia]|uniref:ABC-type sugar transport system, permease component n=1 Tax=Leadbettera azotonutricia (strain ATCC BAA-888 / DSM 13862 / ZAS-9) TaxID=545695 RepID=F5YBQ2_LEAAZ|nr:sugar ABC transporter permease [Leadbettera azotonutricia]AEF80541.1 ABC-type sugar transport system, permease component [Leadbettera azotonutricia ZAS-9]